VCEQRQQQHLPTGGLVVEAVEEHDGTAGVMLQPVACDMQRVKRQVKSRSRDLNAGHLCCLTSSSPS
jgi:hypothetical protein